MTREVSLKLIYGDKVVIQLEPDHEQAVATAYAALIDRLPEETDVFGLPEPVTENDLHDYLTSRGLDHRFGFEVLSLPVTPAPVEIKPAPES